MAPTLHGGPKDQERQTARILLAKLWSKLVEKPLWVMGTLALASALLLVALKFTGGMPPGSFRMEAAKSLLQLIVVGAAGALLKLVADEHAHRVKADQDKRNKAEERRDRRRDKAEERRDRRRDKAEEKRIRDIEASKIELRYREELLKDTAKRITASYNKAKRARRNMRALGLDRSVEPTRIKSDPYDECMAEVNDAQLELEVMKRDVEWDIKMNADAFPSAVLLKPRLKSMESYLSKIIGQYEKARSKSGDSAELILENGTPLSDFVGESTGSRFKSEFSRPHGQARAAINRDLLKLTSAKQALGGGGDGGEPS